MLVYKTRVKLNLICITNFYNNIKMDKKYKFIGKTLFFPKEKILVIGDLHLGYDKMLNKTVMFNFTQIEKVLSELKKVLEKTGKVKKIVLLGDTKHDFSYNKNEETDIHKLFSFLTHYAKEKDIVLIKGNHEKGKNQLKDYYKKNNILFIHGDIEIEEMHKKEVEYIIMSHVHPSLLIRDFMGVKKEKYKCFLIGKYKGKKVIILPSFFSFNEGSSLSDCKNSKKERFGAIPFSKLSDFEVIVTENNKEYNFKKLKHLLKNN